MKTVTLVNLLIQGFKSFNGDEVLASPAKPGLYLLSGENRAEDALGANGAGKSTVWDALCWCLYGKSVRGVRGESLISREASDICLVLAELSILGDNYQIKRTQKPTSLVMSVNDGEWKTVTQEQVSSLLGFEYAAFVHSAIFGQFASSFFDLSPAEKLAVFSDALDLKLWVKASELAKREVASTLDGINGVQRKLAGIYGTIEATEASVVSLKALAEAFDVEQAKTLLELEKRLEDALAERDMLELKQTTVEDQISTAADDVARYRAEMIEKDNQVHHFAELRAGIGADIRASSLSEMKKQRDDFRQLKGKCPRCAQPIDQRHIEVEVAAITQQINAEAARLDALDQQLHELLDQQLLAKNELTAIGNKYDEADGRRKRLIADKSQLSSRLVFVSNVVDSTRAAIKRALETENTALEKLADARGQLRMLAVQASQLTGSELALKKALVHTEYWVKGFRDLRLWLIETALKQFEVEVNNSLIDLGLMGYTIKFDVERENASGGVTKGFAVLVLKEGEDPIPWESWSGGETQRLRLAGAIGFSNLIQSRTGSSWGFEVWDEPTAHLSQEGISDLLNFLSLRAASQKKQVWLIDHRSLDAGDFAGEFRVVKDGKGSHIVDCSKVV